MPDPIAPDAPRLLAALASGSQAVMEPRFWGDGVDRLLAYLGEACGASRIWIFQTIELQDDAVVQDYVFEWASQPRYRQLTQKRFRFFTTFFDDPIYREMVAARQRGEAHGFVVEAMPAGPLRQNLESQAIRSMVTVPIMVNGRWWGTLGIDDCERPLDWQGTGLQALRVATELIASAIYRQQLTSRRRQIELFQRVTDCGIWEVDPRSGATWCSRALLRTLGYPDDYARLPIRRLLAHIAREDRQRLWQRLRRCLCSTSCSWRLDVRLITERGETRWHEIVAEVVRGPSQNAQSLAGLIIDVSQRKQGEERALVAAEYDELTGTLNRRGLWRHLDETLVDDHAPHHLLLLDIDHFKPVNDRHGHPAGDALLRLLAQRLGGELRAHDGLARLGGEEFVIVVSGLAQPEVLQIAERLRTCIADAPFQLEAETALTIPITVSLGIASLPNASTRRHGHTLAIAQADQALYAAKHAGRNRAVGYWQLSDLAGGDARMEPTAD
ncbi:sensor domain-containing diguanylate cyclase [Halomonas faecis]|uniref:sensor domain-containing diguanylate cyclase n=1 Tax=Halomonas faecis TaxID=1562110 RepID=UPI0013D38F55|nr:diguanylate cyclase [Halomonas faecis]